MNIQRSYIWWGGTPVDLDELDTICEEHKEKYGYKPMVVEDYAII